MSRLFRLLRCTDRANINVLYTTSMLSHSHRTTPPLIRTRTIRVHIHTLHSNYTHAHLSHTTPTKHTPHQCNSNSTSTPHKCRTNPTHTTHYTHTLLICMDFGQCSSGFVSGICDILYSAIFTIFSDISRNIYFHKNPNNLPKALSKTTYVDQFSGPEVP